MGSEDQAKSVSTEQTPIQVLCSFVNVYKGDRETLPAFLTNCQNALDLASENQKVVLLKFIISKLEGKAQIACSNKIFEKFEDLKSFLKQNFGETKHYNHLLLDLQACKQQVNETVAQYALRVETCLTQLQSEIHNSDSYKKEIPGRIAMTEDLALYTFSLGLKPNISNMVRCKSPKNLNSAINIAIEEEKIQNLSFRSGKHVKFCKICRREGHLEANCYNGQRSSLQVPSYQRQTNDAANSPRSLIPKSSPITCRYCKNIGHDISQCRKRQFNNTRFANNTGQRHADQNCLDCAPVTFDAESPQNEVYYNNANTSHLN
ncbi:uncharacterized protein [Choristoneura fumiferana]|uniref:uncharacterized protein n=1 Tax=Choristoneura fumiferana TaxID=7141 RepID=UPI003D15E6A9